MFKFTALLLLLLLVLLEDEVDGTASCGLLGIPPKRRPEELREPLRCRLKRLVVELISFELIIILTQSLSTELLFLSVLFTVKKYKILKYATHRFLNWVPFNL